MGRRNQIKNKKRKLGILSIPATFTLEWRNDFIYSITTQDARKQIPFHKGLNVKYTHITVRKTVKNNPLNYIRKIPKKKFFL